MWAVHIQSSTTPGTIPPAVLRLPYLVLPTVERPDQQYHILHWKWIHLPDSRAAAGGQSSRSTDLVMLLVLRIPPCSRHFAWFSSLANAGAVIVDFSVPSLLHVVALKLAALFARFADFPMRDSMRNYSTQISCHASEPQTGIHIIWAHSSRPMPDKRPSETCQPISATVFCPTAQQTHNLRFMDTASSSLAP